LIQRNSASGSLATCAAFTVFPCSLITQIAVFSSDTFSPMNSLIPQSSHQLRNSNGATLPTILQR
jgi:hypothetical protein